MSDVINKVMKAEAHQVMYPIRMFIEKKLDVNSADDKIKWYMRIEDLKTCYKQHCEKKSENMFSLSDFYWCMESIPGVYRDKTNLKINGKWKAVRCWVGIRIKGASGIILEDKK